MMRTTDKKGGMRDLGWKIPPNGPLPANRLVGFAGLLDITISSKNNVSTRFFHPDSTK